MNRKQARKLTLRAFVAIAALIIVGGVSAAGNRTANASSEHASLLSSVSFAHVTPPKGFLSLFTGSVGTAAGFEDDDANLAADSMTDWNTFAPTTWNGQLMTKTQAPWTLSGASDATASTSDSGFAGGTKEDDSCPTVIGTKSPNKDDLARIYIAGENLSGHVYLMLAWVRIPQNSTSSDEHVAFEFNQGSADCGSGGLKVRTAGDLLIVYDFTSGGTPTFSLSKWVTSGSCEVGADSPPCWGPQQAISAAEGAVNTGTGTITDNIAPSAPATLGTSEFGEAGIDLTAATTSSSGRQCERFGTAFAVSRSSGSSSTAQMEDLVGPAPIDLSNCVTPSISTTPNPTSGNIGTKLNDTASVTGGNGPTGTVTFNLYGPSDQTCAGTPLYTETANLSSGSAATTGGPSAAAAGTYHWTATYNGDGNNNVATSACADEAVTIAKSSPGIATTPTPTSGAIGTMLNDTATVSGGTSPSGTVTFKLYGPSDQTCSGTPLYTETGNLSGGNAATTGGPAAAAAGTYHWAATYNGDAANNTASSACADEAVTIAKNSPTLATTLSATTATAGDTVHDSSALTGATANAGGTVTYTVYSNDTCSAGARDAGTKTVTNGVPADSNGLVFNAAGTFYWQAVYSGDSNNNGATSPCKSEILTVGKKSPTIATTLSATTGSIGDTVHDSSALTGATSDAGGTVTYTVYSNDTCTAGARDAGTKAVTNGVPADSNGLAFNTAGTFYWQAVYSGDANNNGATSPCKDEVLTIGKNAPSIATTLSKDSAAIGDSVHDSSALTGATSNAGGTVTYTVYSNDTCSAGARDAGTKAVTSGVPADSNGLVFNAAGTYYWQAVYSGDANNNGATSPCKSEILTIGKNTPSIATTLSEDTGSIGDTVHDSSALTGATVDAGGTVTYTVYTNDACSAGARDAGTKTVTGGLVPNSNGLAFNAAGTFYWQAVYSGDANNAGATSPCKSEILTIGKNSPSIATILSDDTVTVGDTVHDTAQLSGATADAGGTVTYTVYSNDTCTTGARDAGTKAVTSGAVADSDGLVFNSAGTFYWRAVYSGDSNNDGATSPCKSEILTVAKRTPSIATTLSADAGAVGDTVHDSSALTGATSDAGGTVTYTVYSNAACTLGARDAGTKAVTNGSVADSNGLVFNAAGTFYWQAVYSGDANNAGATSPCQSEILTIGKNAPTISTTLSATSGAIGDTVHDSSTLSGATSDAGGTVTYTVYSNDTCTTGARDAGTKAVTNGSVADSDGLAFNSAGTFYWQAEYSGDANNKAATSPCKDEILTIGKNTPSIATTLSATTGSIGDPVHDSSALTGATTTAGGTVTYTVYSNDTCSAGARDAGTKDVTDGVVDDSNALTFDAAGTYYWQAVYSGDANNAGATSPCKDEILTIGKNSPTLATILSESEAAIGDTVNDTAQLSGATSDAGGTVTYTAYSDSQCSADARDAGTKAVTDGSVADSDGLSFNSAGTFYWQAVYSGDANNHGATSPCQSEILTVDKNHPTISTTLSADEVVVGSTVHDSSALDGATSDAGGTVTYSVYTNNECSGDGRNAGTKDVTDGKPADSDPLEFDTAGTFYWQAVYSGDANNMGARSACTEEKLAVDHPAIAITKNPKSQAVDSGGTATFMITVTNTGTVDLTNVTVTDALAPNCAKTIGDLAKGASKSYSCTLAGVTSPFTNTATATGQPPVGPDVTASDTADVTVNVAPPAPPAPPAPKIDLAIVKTVTPASSTLGDRVTWTLTITNNGPDNATGVTVADPIPAGMRYISSTTTQGTCTFAALLNCQIGSMANGATVKVTIVTASTATGQIVNTATVVGNEPETNTANNTATAQAQVKGAFVPPAPVCTAVGVSPKQLLVGHQNTLRIRVTQKGRGVQGIRVRIHGATLGIVTAPSNSKGLVTRSVRPMKPGIVVFRPVAKKGCRVTRVGVIGVFTPPVTG